VDVAIAAGADVLITNDRHFDVLQQIEFPKVQTLTLQQFLAQEYDGSDGKFSVLTP
jgi:predicted nucleic acid-binding protein